MFKNDELEAIIEKLEELEDEKLAVELLKELNSLSSQHGKLILNRDPSLTHDEWKKSCDEVSDKLEQLIEKISKL